KFLVKGVGHAFGTGARGAAVLNKLPSITVLRIPEPSTKPTLEKPVYSEAIGFTEFPGAWLPFVGAKQVTALRDYDELDRLSATAMDEFTASLVTEQPTQVRYAM